MRSASPSARRRRLGDLFARIRGIAIHHRLIARDLLVVLAFAVVAKGAGAAKEIVVAWRYGVSDEVDAYAFVWSLVNAPSSIAFSILTVVFIPVAVRLRTASADTLREFRAEFLGATTLAAAFLGVTGFAALELVLRSSLIGLSSSAREVGLLLLPWLAFVIPLGLLIHCGSALLMSEGRHSNTLVEGVPSLILVLALLAAGGAGPEPLGWGTALGFAIQLVALAAIIHWRGLITGIRFSFESPAWKHVAQGTGLMLIAQTLQTSAVVVDQFFAAALEAGAVATLSYSDRILSLGMTLGATVVPRAILPILSRLEAGRVENSLAAAKRWAHIMFAFGCAVLAIGWSLAPILVELVYQRGAFTQSDVNAVSDVLRYGLLQVPFYFGALVLVQGLLSQRRYEAMTWIALMHLLSKLVLSVLLIPILGLKGLMISTAVMYGTSFLVLSVLYQKPLKSRPTI